MQMLKRVLTWILVGMGLGLAGALFAGPGMVGAMYKPLSGSAAMNCSGDVRLALDQMVRFQLWSGAIAAIVVPVVAFLVVRRFGKKPTPAQPAPALPPQA